MNHNKNKTTQNIEHFDVEITVPTGVRKLITWTIILVAITVCYIVIRWIIGPPGVLIDTTNLSGFGKMFYNFTNSLKIPRKFIIKN